MPKKEHKEVLIIENEEYWIEKLSEVFKKFNSSEVFILKEYNEAENFLSSKDLSKYDAIVIDVKLREQIYDQAGLALLDIVKQNSPDIPTLILTAYSYDYPGLRRTTDRYEKVLVYDKDIFVNNSKRILDALFSNLPPQIGDNYLPGERYMDSSAKPKKNKVFISYSHADKEWLERLKIHIKPFEKKGIIDLWDDTKIKPGMLWREEIKKALDSTKVAVLLVSADFLASDFIIENELPPLLSAAEKEGAVIIPVILKPCAFSESELEKFQSINPPSKALSGLSKHEQEEVLVKVAKSIKEALEK